MLLPVCLLAQVAAHVACCRACDTRCRAGAAASARWALGLEEGHGAIKAYRAGETKFW